MLGVSTIARGIMNGGYLNVLLGLFTIIIGVLEILALGDIVLNGCVLDVFSHYHIQYGFCRDVHGSISFNS